MKLLLDTHIWLWSLSEPERLVRRVQNALASPNAELWLSAISVWEILMMADRKRVRFDPSVDQWLALARRALPLRDAPFSAEIALATRDVKLPHRDPADLFIVATARVLGLTLVTSDQHLIKSAQVPILSNR